MSSLFDIKPALLVSLPSGLELSGITAWCLRLSGALVRAGHRVTIVAHEDGTRRPGTGAVVPAGVGLVRLEGVPPLDRCSGRYGAYMPAYREAVASLAEASGAPVVVLPTLYADSYGLFAALSQVEPESLRVVSWVHSDIEHDYRVAGHYEPLIARFVGVSRAIAGRLRRENPHRAGDVERVPYGVEVAPSLPDREPVEGRALRLVYCGRLEHRQKRIGALIAMSEALARLGIEHTLTLAGDGPAAEEMERLSRDSERIRVIRRNPDGSALTPDDLRRIMRRADVFVMASRYEGLSVALLEAIGQGCVPVVTRIASGVDEVVLPGLSGEVADWAEGSDASVGASLAQGVVRAMERGLAEQAEAAWRLARDEFSLEKHTESALGVLHRAAASPARRWPGDRACSAGAVTSAGAFSVPSDAIDRAERMLGALTGRRVALWGAGRHTVALAPVLAETGARVEAVIEDDPARRGGTIWGWPLVSRDEAIALGVTDVVISSWMHEEAMWRERDAFEGRGVRVHRLYGAGYASAAA